MWTVPDVDTDKVEELSSDGHFDSDDDDGGVLVSQPSSASSSPSCANPAATNQSTVDLLTETQNREGNHLKIQKIYIYIIC